MSGIGPKTERELNERGIYTFAQLAAIDPDYLTELVNELEWGEINHPETWPEQARRLDEAKRNR